MNSQLDDYVPFSGDQSIDLTGSGNFGSLSVSGVPVVTGSIDTSNFALLNHDHDTDYASIGHSHSLYQLDDVNIGATIDGQVLQWNDSSSAWVAETLDFASTDHVHSEYLDDSDLTEYSVTASAAANGLTPSAPAWAGSQYYTAMTADNQFVAISYTDDNGSETVGKVDIFKRNTDGTLSDRFSVDLGAASAALPIAIAKLSALTFDEFTINGIAPAGSDGGLILYNALSYDGSSGQLAKAHYISLVGDETDNTVTATDLGFITTSSFTEQAHSISITDNGEKVALGCFDSNADGSNSGRVFVYKLESVATPSFTEIRDYVGSTPQGAFGSSLSYRGDGEMLAVGAPGNTTTAGAVIVIDDSDANYSAVSANLAAGESPYERKFSLAIFSNAFSYWDDYLADDGATNYQLIEITDLPVNDFFATPVLNNVTGGDVTTLSMVTANEGKVYSFEYHEASPAWVGKGAPFTSTVGSSNAYSIDSSEDGTTIVVAYSAFSSLSEFDFTGHQIKRFVHNSTTNSWDSGTIVANIPDADASSNKFKSVLIASDGSFITTAMSSTIASGGATDGLFRVYEYQNVYATREHNHTLSSLSDLDETFLSGGIPSQDGAALIWNAHSGKWRATSSFLWNKNLNDLSDVGGYNNANLTGGEVLQWNANTNQFETATIAGADYSNGIEVDQFVATPFLSLKSQDMASSLASISAEESTQAGVGATVQIVAFGGTVSIGDAGAAGGECDLNVTNNLTVGGNLTVNGTATTVNTTNLDVEDSIIKLNLNGGGNFEAGGVGGSSGIEIEAGEVIANGGNDRKARFVYNSGDSTAASYGTDLGFFEATYEEDNAGLPVLGHLKMKVKGLEVERTSDATASAADVASGEVSDQPGFDNLGNFEDFMSGLNA
jgi:hypothetical protein